MILALTTAPKVPEWPSYNNFCKAMAILGRSLKTTIFWKSAKGRRTEIFQKLPKKKPWLQRANRTLVQMSLSSNLNPLIVQRPEKILARQAAPKLPEWPSYGNFCKVTQNPHFLKKCKGGTKANFSKIAQKVALVWKGQKHSGGNGIIL